MFYRRKIILALLELFGGELDKICLQKLLFLIVIDQQKPEYQFVPYKYGCYSYSANADILAMARRNILTEAKELIIKCDSISYFKQLKPSDQAILKKVKSEFGGMDARALMKYTYVMYPFFATRSEVAADILTNHELKRVRDLKAQLQTTVLYTIGYEGISLEEYLVRLLKNDVKVLVDVRNNPLSMKYGFSKNQLKRYCESIGIKYVHIPEVGIQSQQRKQLENQADYDKLFAIYRKKNLPTTVEAQMTIFSLLEQHKRIALTCFEANICQCHRKHLAEAIQKLNGFKYKLEHI
jgi:uncharacterized protein (DUF488 family)